MEGGWGWGRGGEVEIFPFLGLFSVFLCLLDTRLDTEERLQRRWSGAERPKKKKTISASEEFGRVRRRARSRERRTVARQSAAATAYPEVQAKPTFIR